MIEKRTKVALIACSNGMGHVRRMLALAKSLHELGADPVLLAPKEKSERLIALNNSFKPKIINFQSKTRINDWLSGKAYNWAQTLPDLSIYHSVVSDNLLEILHIRKDAWLSGSFIWQYALSGIASNQVRNADKILNQYNPRMISSTLFAADYLAKKTRLFKVGLFSFCSSHKYHNGTDILISTGTGGAICDEVEIFLDEISNSNRPIKGVIWIEPSLWKSHMPSWIIPADFTPQMYQKIRCAIIRPGVGTVTDCLLYGARIFSFYEKDNYEMRNNATKIQRAGVGEDSSNINQAWVLALNYYENSPNQTNHQKAFAVINRNGAMDAAALILGNQDS